MPNGICLDYHTPVREDFMTGNLKSLDDNTKMAINNAI